MAGQKALEMDGMTRQKWDVAYDVIDFVSRDTTTLQSCIRCVAALQYC